MTVKAETNKAETNCKAEESCNGFDQAQAGQELAKQEAVPLQEGAVKEAVPLQEEAVPQQDTEMGGMLKIFESICTKYGGPSQYLLSRYSSNEAVAHFGEKLEKNIRRLEVVRYFDPKSMKPMNKEKLFLHVTMLGFNQAATTKPLPYPKVCIALADEYLTHTFLSSDEPLQVWVPHQSEAQPFQMRYVKGMARASTLLCLLDLIIDRDAADKFPNLFASAAVIHATFEVHVDLASVAIANANVSARGSIRQAHDVITWTSKLLLLVKQGVNAKEVLARFNCQATKQACVTGARMIAVTTLLQPPCHEGLEVMLALLAEVGPNQVFWDEHAFSNKRIAPGYVPRAGNKTWQDVLKVTGQSFTLMVQMLAGQCRDKPPNLRLKLNKNSLEEYANLSSMVVWLTSSFLEAEPSHGPVVQEFLEAFKNGDHEILLELQGHLHDKSNNYNWRDCSFLASRQKTLKDESIAMVTGKTTSVDATTLEDSEFALFEQRMKYDLAAMEVYFAKRASHESLLYHQKLQRRIQRHQQASEAVDTLFNGPAPQFSFIDVDALGSGNKSQKCLHLLSEIETAIRAREGVPPQQPLYGLVVINWAAPSCTPGKYIMLQEAMLGGLVNSVNLDAMGVVFTPVWERKKGLLYKTENMFLDKIANSGVNCDDRAVLSFAERIDLRDRRPLEYPIRLCFSAVDKESIWRKVPLVQNNRVTERASMLHTKDMKLIESLNDQSVPETSNTDPEINPAERYSQLGDGATAAILDNTVRALAPPSRAAVLLVDCGPKTGDWARSILRMIPSMSCGTYYVALGDAAEIEWTKQQCHDLAIELFKEGTLNIPGFRKPTLFDEEEEAALPIPALQVCGFEKGKELGPIRLPSEYDKWKTVARFAERFEQLQSQVNLLGKICGKESLEPSHDTTTATPNAKRQRLCPVPSEVPQVEITSIGTGMIQDVSLSHQGKGLALRVMQNHVMYVVNPTTEPMEIKVGMFCAGFLKGKWRKMEKAEDTDDHDIALVLNNADTVVIKDREKDRVRLGELVEEGRAAKGTANIRYHKIIEEPKPDDPGYFRLEVTNQIYWRMDPFKIESGSTEPRTVSQTVLAAAIPLRAWKTEYTGLAWYVRWAAAGITAVKPVIIFTKHVVIEGGKAVCITE